MAACNSSGHGRLRTQEVVKGWLEPPVRTCFDVRSTTEEPKSGFQTSDRTQEERDRLLVGIAEAEKILRL